MSPFGPKHFAALLEYEREWIESLVAAMAWRARSCERDTRMTATETIAMALRVRAELFRN